MLLRTLGALTWAESTPTLPPPPQSLTVRRSVWRREHPGRRAGNDLIIGGQGRDILVGGFGNHDYNNRPATDSGTSERGTTAAQDNAWLAVVDDGVSGDGSGAKVEVHDGALDILFSKMAEAGTEQDGKAAG